jgi:hypothetical protein
MHKLSIGLTSCFVNMIKLSILKLINSSSILKLLGIGTIYFVCSFLSNMHKLFPSLISCLVNMLKFKLKINQVIFSSMLKLCGYLQSILVFIFEQHA